MKALITSVRCEVLGSHAHVTVFNRGACAGKLVVNAPDGIKLAELLIPEGSEELDATGSYTRRAPEIAQ